VQDDRSFIAPSARTHPEPEFEETSPSSPDCLALIIIWSAREPERVGEVALCTLEHPLWVIGRCPGWSASHPGQAHPEGDATGEAVPVDLSFSSSDGASPLGFFRQRPLGISDSGSVAAASPNVGGEAISRRQLLIRATADSLIVENIGRCELSVNGTVARTSTVVAGDTLYLRNQLLLLCARRPLVMPALRAYPSQYVGAFGTPDQQGIVGESLAIWHLRDRLAMSARTNFHVLVIGESGSGKELAVQAMHRISTRAERTLIADNISTIPSSLASALLFGNKKNFPNPGMEERIGLIRAAHGSTLFLDEIGDMPEEVQPMFLRVMERNGEYFRLGEESRLQRSDFRLIGATNRPGQLRYELKRRFQREVVVPGLNQRKEDVPLLITHALLEQAASGDVDAPRFLRHGQPRLHPRLVEQLVHHTYKTHVSEISFLLGRAMAESSGDILQPLGSTVEIEPQSISPLKTKSRPGRLTPRSLPAPELAQQALNKHGGDVTRTAAALNISRDQLNRMIRREGLQVPRTRASGSGPNGSKISDSAIGHGGRRHGQSSAQPFERSSSDGEAAE
jgi:two-component system response regulator HydG